MVRFPDTDDQEKTSENTSFFSYTTFLLDDHVCSTYMTELIDFSGTMILDTACQRACCGRVWLDLHTKILDTHRLSVKHIETADMFQFGSGGPKRSAQRTYFPASLAGQEAQGLLLGVNVLDADVPFLASNTMLQKLGCIIDTSQSLVSFAVLGVTLPLEFKHGHWAVNICCFSTSCSSACMLERVEQGFILAYTGSGSHFVGSLFGARSDSRSIRSSCRAVDTSCSTTGLPPEWLQKWRNHHLEGDDDRVQSLGSDVPACEVWFETTPMDDGVGTGRDQEGSVEGRGTVLEDDSSTIPCRLAHTRSSEGMAIGAEATLSASDAWQSFQWNPDDQGWLQLGGQSSSRSTPLPLPSSDNILCPVTRLGRDSVQADSFGESWTQAQGQEISDLIEHLTTDQGPWQEGQSAHHPPSRAGRPIGMDSRGVKDSLGRDSNNLYTSRTTS